MSIEEATAPGVTASEFWQLLGGQAGPYAAALSTKNPWLIGLAMTLSSALIGAYIWKRGTLKAEVVKASKNGGTK